MRSSRSTASSNPESRRSISRSSPAQPSRSRNHAAAIIYAGSRNLGNDIEVRVGRRPSQRTIARSARLAKNALPHPSRAQQMLEELAGKYAIAMLIVAVARRS